MKEFFLENEISTALEQQILPFLGARRTEGHFAGYDGKPLHFVRYRADAPRGTVLMLHGLGESAEKYRELIYYVLREGLSVLIYDQRGHGGSYRTVRRGLVHVDRFEEYVEDAACALDQLRATCPAPYFLFGHSMGGAVATLLLEKGNHPFARAVLSSPMIRTVRYPHLPPELARLGCCVLSALGFAKRGVSRRKSQGQEDFANSCALSRARFDAYAALKRDHPEYAGGTITFGWTREAIGVTKRILAKGAPESIRIPVRLYSAGRDHLVEAAEQQELAQRLPKGELVTVADSKHEIYMASDDILHPYLDSVLDFFSTD